MADRLPVNRRIEGQRPDVGPRAPSGRPAHPQVVEPSARPGHRQRVPHLSDLVRLVVNGILTLPRNYRRGMFLDIFV